jgi:plasmid stabilization system protein ParE
VATLRPLTLRYSARARLQLLAIHEHIAREGNPTAAVRVGRAIREAAELLAYFPLAGREGKIASTREWVVRQLPYIIVYEIAEGEPGTLAVLGIFHARQQRSYR